MEPQEVSLPRIDRKLSARETVLYTNTASFLFDRLRKDSSSGVLAHELTAKGNRSLSS